MEKQYFINEIETLKSIPNPCPSVLALIEDFTEIVNRVLPWETESRLNAGMIRSNRFKGAYYVLTSGIKIYREEYPMYYFLLKDANLPEISIAHSTIN